jgi:NhaA family Na+:H+ antiporter
MPPPVHIRTPWSRSQRPLARRVAQPAQQFLHQEAASGIILLLATIAALVWANVDPSGYTSFWHTTFAIQVGDWGHVESLSHVVNDGLMALFFFVIGLEVKRELTTGELADRRAAMLPILAALGGMLLPAMVFLVIAGGDSIARNGWGIPMATDIAFALGVLALLGSRVPPALKVLLLGIAVIDDIGAIIVIAVFYSSGVEWQWLGAAVLGLLAIIAIQRVHVRSLVPYVALGMFVWLATFESGIHATIAGVVLGLLTPARPFQRGDAVSEAAVQIAAATDDAIDDPDKDSREWQALAWLSRESVSPLTRLESSLHPWTAGFVLPLFALANVGIAFDLDSMRDAVTSSLAIGIACGLVLGKPVGIVLGAWIAVRSGLATLPDGIRWSHIVGIGSLAGIGFTMSLFVTMLAFSEPDLIKSATFAVLFASMIAAIVGVFVLLRAGTVDESAEAAPPVEAGSGAPEVGA